LSGKEIDVNKAGLKFRDAGKVLARSLVTCGFELETQETEGHRWESIAEDDGEIDEEAAEDAIEQDVAHCLTDLYWITTYVRAWPEHLASMTEATRRLSLSSKGLTSLSALVENEIITQAEAERVERRIRENIRDHFNWSAYTVSRDPDEYMRDNYTIPRTIDITEDGSVDGFEFRTIGPQTYSGFKKAADAIFRLDHDIDTGCSFHIHLAVKGVKHQWGERMQSALVQYLIENIDRVPASVRERWEAIDSNQFIRELYASKAKYSFVHKHKQGTWEFRCFGNVQNAKDAMRCLDLAIEAMQYAYAVLTGEAALVTDSLSMTFDEIAELSYEALRAGTSLSKMVRRNKLPRAA
jgi:hypothetical protein